MWLAGNPIIGASMDMIGWLRLLLLTWMSLAGNPIIGASMDMIGWLQLLLLTWISLAGNTVIIMVAIGFPHLPIVTVVSVLARHNCLLYNCF